MFKYIVSVVTISGMETLEAKIENLKLCGLSTEETWRPRRPAPHIFFFLCKENVSENMSLLVNKMDLPANYIVNHTSFLLVSLEKTMRPKCLVVKSIDDPHLPLLRVLRMLEARFISKIIEGHPESKTLQKIYENVISNASNHTKSSTKS